MDIQKILDSFTYEESENQEGTFTPEHVRYDCTFEHDGKYFTCEYQVNPRYHKFPLDAKEILNCILSDCTGYEECKDIYDFLDNFGYGNSAKNMRKGAEIYERMQEQYQELHEWLNNGEYAELYDKSFEEEW